jgi:hypothetical protein
VNCTTPLFTVQLVEEPSTVMTTPGPEVAVATGVYGAPPTNVPVSVPDKEIVWVRGVRYSHVSPSTSPKLSMPPNRSILPASVSYATEASLRAVGLEDWD